MTWQIIEADCIEAMRGMDEASVGAVVTDPPYMLEFMGRSWDRPMVGDSGDLWDAGPKSRGVAGNYRRSELHQKMREAQTWHQAWATEALRVLKPGGHLLAAGGTRTFHRLVSAIEDAGFEIRDCIAHMYGSGFPKSLNVGDGRGTALKPAFEPWTLARKPLVGTVAQNVERFGTGAINVDACRIGVGETDDIHAKNPHTEGGFGHAGAGIYGDSDGASAYDPAVGRWPANLTLSHLPGCEFGCEGAGCDEHHNPPCQDICAPGCPVAELDQQSGESTARIGEPRTGANGDGWGMTATGAEYADRGGASRFFYVAKSSRAERTAGVGANAHPT